jgi:membrane protease YdiL (CAAX protease family)
MVHPNKTLTRSDFLRIATLFEGGLVVVAYLLGWIGDIDPLADLNFNIAALTWGVAGTVPLYLLFLISYRLPIDELQSIKRLLIDKMGPLLDVCRWQDMIYLGLLAGVTEEVLFRGLLQPWIESAWGWEAGLIGSNILFAFAHWITPLYAILAGLTGLYLGIALDISGERNLGVPILIHALYDILAFMAVTRTYREKNGRFF